MSCEAFLGSAGFLEGHVASFEVEGTLARLTDMAWTIQSQLAIMNLAIVNGKIVIGPLSCFPAMLLADLP